MNAYTIAETLHKTAKEILALDPDEYVHWIAYFKIREAERKKVQKEQENKRPRRTAQSRRIPKR